MLRLYVCGHNHALQRSLKQIRTIRKSLYNLQCTYFRSRNRINIRELKCIKRQGPRILRMLHEVLQVMKGHRRLLPRGPGPRPLVLGGWAHTQSRLMMRNTGGHRGGGAVDEG